MEDHILIEGLHLPVLLGVPEEERADWQNVIAEVCVFPICNWIGLEDQIENTIDYAEVTLVLKREAASRPRKLIEVLANDLCAVLLMKFPISKVRLKLSKRIVPGTKAVSVQIERRRES